MYDCGQQYTPYMQMMGLPSQLQPMMTMPQEDLERMYPRIYYQVYPAVQRHCDMAEATYGPTFTPTREHLDKMVDDVLAQVKVEVDVDVDVKVKSPRDDDDRQFPFAGRRLLRDLVSVLFIRDLLRRRRRPFGAFPGYYGGFPGGFYGGFPGYYY